MQPLVLLLGVAACGAKSNDGPGEGGGVDAGDAATSDGGGGTGGATDACLDIQAADGADLRVVVAAYFPWYGTPRGPTGGWAHWEVDGNPIITNHPPAYYDSRDPELVRTHFAMARQAGVDAFALSWWGSSSPENTNVAVMFDTALADDSPMRLAIHFETGGIATENLASELDAVLTAYGSHPNYLQIDGRPVVYLYNAGQHPADVWSAALSSAQVAEHDAFFFADGIGGDEYLTADMFDGLYASGPMFEYADGLLREAHEYGSSRARSVGLLYSGTVFPGYDDRIIRTPSLVVERNGGKTYEESWYEASRVKPDLIFITSWNEWHEGSEIEPSIEHGDRSLELTAACLELLAPGRAAAAGS